MYIFLDESYNLKDRSLPQLISINGFQTVNVKKVWKRWMEYRRRYVGRWRIHATDAVFEPLRKRALRLAQALPDIILVSVCQMINEIPVGRESPYWRKDKLDFEKVYEDMLKSLFDRLQFHAYREAIITIDNRKMKEGILGKKKLQEHVLTYLKQCYPVLHAEFRPVISSTSVLVELADFYSNTLYKEYVGRKISQLDTLKGKTIAIQNPL